MANRPLPDRLLIPFGSKDWQADRAVVSIDKTGALTFDCQVSHVVLEIKAQQALRLNSDWYRLYERPPMSELRAPEDRFKFIVDHMTLYCDAWDKFQTLFLEKYFEFIEHHAQDHQDELTEKLHGMATLYSYQDWLLSAYLPLPQALVFLPQDSKDQSYEDENMIRVPLLFWTGAEAIAVFFVGSDTPSPRLRNIQARLREGGYRVVEIAQHTLLNEEAANRQEFFTEIFGTFWRDEKIPSGPFKPVLADPEI